jgi:signal transduction histidine kinase/ligand-binding sensor domain-containing protein
MFLNTCIGSLFTTVMGCIVWITLLEVPALALDPNKAITQFHHEFWGAEKGLDKVRMITQTADGYIWVISGTRVLRFDGLHFVSGDPPLGEAQFPLVPDRIFASGDGSLWVGSGSEITRVRQGHSTVFGAKDGMTAGHVTALGEDRNVIWVGGYLGLCKFTNGHWAKIGLDSGFPDGEVRDVILDRDKTLWVSLKSPTAPDMGLMAWLPRGETRFRVSKEQFETAYKLAAGPDGKIWTAQTQRSVRGFVREEAGIRFTAPEMRVGSQSILFDRDGGLWIATLGDGLFRIRNTTVLGPQDILRTSEDVDQYGQRDGLLSDYDTCIFEDREGVVWVGGSSGLDSFTENKFANYSTREGLPANINLILQGDSSGRVWAASDSYGFERLVAGNLQLPGRQSPAFPYTHKPTSIYCLYDDGAAGVLAGTSDGVVLANTPGLDPLSCPGAAELHSVVCMARDGEGGLWLSDRDQGLFREVSGRLTQMKRPLLPNDFVLTMVADKTGRVWFGYLSGLVDCYDAGNFRRYSAGDGLVVQEIRVILSDARGNIWIAGDAGIGRFHEGRFQLLDQNKAALGDKISAMIEDDAGFFWLGGMDGICRLDSADLEKEFSSQTEQINVERFGFEEGLRGFVRQAAHGYPGLGYPLATKSADGRLWFSTSGGLAVIDPRRIPQNSKPPPVYIERLVANGKTYVKTGLIEFPQGARNCEIDYVGLSFANTAKMGYRYKLEGHDTEWVDAGAQRQAFYSNLRPRKYRFLVSARNSDGIWNEVGDSVEFSIAPAFYETNWFVGAAVFVFGFAIFGLHRMRLARITARLKIQARAQEEERQRIAVDLHDTLLQGLTGIGLKLHVIAKNAEQCAADVQNQLQAVIEQSDHCLDEARRSVWKLRPGSSNRSANFSDVLAASARSRLPDDVVLDFSVRGDSRPLSSAIEDNLLRICMEAVSNAVKHARASQIHIELEFTPQTVRARVRDNGRGFDAQNSAASKEGHFGLAAMRERARSIGGIVSIESQPGHGVEVIVTAPLA